MGSKLGGGSVTLYFEIQLEEAKKKNKRKKRKAKGKKDKGLHLIHHSQAKNL